MIAPKLTVVVPTRERADTLVHTLRTLVEQDYSDCEIIVSDNYSQDNTKQIVDTFADSRLQYINTGSRVGMSENWEFALQHARGTYITYIGDDDGFIPGALSGAMAILDESNSNALVWDKAEYCWPDYIDENMRNWFSLKSKQHSIRRLKGKNKLCQVIKFTDAYNRLPCLYNGIIRKSLLNEIKEKSINGVFFNSISPDVYSGIVLSMVVKEYLHTDFPFSVNGASRHSNGTSFARQIAAGRDSPYTKFSAENTRIYDSRIEMGPSPLICVMGEYMLAKQFLPSLALSEPSWRHYVNSLVRSARSSFLPSLVLNSARYTANQLGLKAKIPEQCETFVNSVRPNIGFTGENFNYIAPLTMVGNIYDACHLVSGMVPNIENISYHSPIAIFVKNIYKCLIIELKNLYRAF